MAERAEDLTMRLPYAEVEFDDLGALIHPEQVPAAVELIHAHRATDVLVLTHGWNSTLAQARLQYAALIESLVHVRAEVRGAQARRLVVVGVLWPSSLWAAVVDSGPAALQDQIRESMDDAATARELQALVARLRDAPEAARTFIALLRTALPDSSPGEDGAAFSALAHGDADAVMAVALETADENAERETGTGLVDRFWEALRNLLNITAYYRMKERAGVVGRVGIASLLDRLDAGSPGTRIHLVGHSFGGRAAAAAALRTRAPLASLSLLQAAFSHYGMARDWDGTRDGSFADVPAKVQGPILVTFTRNDRVVGIAYPLASRLARQIGSVLGDRNDPYGAIGRNGALKTPAALPPTELLEVGGTYRFQPGRVSSLDADAYIHGHADVTGPQVAYAVLSAVVAGQ